MQSEYNPMDIENKLYNSNYYETHIVKKKDSTGTLNLISSDTSNKIEKAKTAIIGRVIQWYNQDPSSPDAINGVFIQHLENILQEPYQQQEVTGLRNRLTNLINNAESFETFKRDYFSNTVVTPVGLKDLHPLIEQAKSFQKKLQETKKDPVEKVKPETEKIMNLNKSLKIVFDKLRKADPKKIDGIFRLAGDPTTVNTLYESINKDSQEILTAKLEASENYIAFGNASGRSVGKMTPPLIDPEIYGFFIAVDEQKTMDQKLKILQSSIKLLPKENQELLKTILQFLHELSKKSDFTRMTSENLAIVWGPNLLIIPKNVTDYTKMQKDMASIKRVTQLMIDRAPELFVGQP